MRVRVANAGRANADQNVARTNGGHIDFPFLERRSKRDEADSFHDRGRLAVLTCHVERSETSLLVFNRPARRNGQRSFALLSYPSFTKYFQATVRSFPNSVWECQYLRN